MTLEEILQECAYIQGVGNGLIHRVIRRYDVFVSNALFGRNPWESVDVDEQRYLELVNVHGEGMSDNALFWGLLYLDFCKYEEERFEYE